MRVRSTSLKQVEYLAAMEYDHLLCMQVFCGASEAGQPAASGIPGSNGRRSLRVLDRAWSQQVQAQTWIIFISLFLGDTMFSYITRIKQDTFLWNYGWILSLKKGGGGGDEESWNQKKCCAKLRILQKFCTQFFILVVFSCNFWFFQMFRALAERLTL